MRPVWIAVTPLLVIGALRIEAAGAQALRTLTATRDLYVDANTADLTRITGMLVGRNGDIIMRQMSDGLIRYFDSRGTPFTFGRMGDGPNEFRNLREAGFVGDTVWAADIGLGRVTLISPSRTSIRMYDFPRVITTPGPNGPYTTSASFPVAIYSDGSHLMWLSTVLQGGMGGGIAGGRGSGGGVTVSGVVGSGGGGASVITPPVPVSSGARGPRFTPPPWFRRADTTASLGYVRVTAAGQFDRVVAWLPRVDCGVRFRTPSGGTGNALTPFCAPNLDAIASDGDRVAIVTGVNATSAPPGYRLIVIGSDADTLVSRTITYRPVAIPREKNDSVINGRIEQTAGRGGFAEAYRSMRLPTHYPPVRAIVVGRDKTIWLESWTPAAERSWTVLDPRGNPIATLKLPANVTLLAADLESAWGTETDVDGLNSVVRYRLR
jgi:hypothetical protein